VAIRRQAPIAHDWTKNRGTARARRINGKTTGHQASARGLGALGKQQSRAQANRARDVARTMIDRTVNPQRGRLFKEFSRPNEIKNGPRTRLHGWTHFG
jgi:hypothetical protein